MKRSFALLFVVPVAMYAWACSSSSGSGNNTSPDGGNTTPDGSSPLTDGSTPPSDGSTPPGDSSVPTTTNPIDGIATATLVVDQAGFPNGLREFNSLLYVSDPYQNVQFTVDPTSAASNVLRDSNNDRGAIGIAIDSKKTTLMTAETAIPFTGSDGVHDAGGQLVGDVVHLSPSDGGITLIANSYDAGTGPLVAFDSPNDLTMRKSDGTIYVTDPGFQNLSSTNHVFKIAPSATVGTVVDTCIDSCNYNGVVISPDEKTLYVGLTYVGSATTPYIKKFTVATDGTVSGGASFAAVGQDLDGMAIDDNGNVYASFVGGIAVFAPDGTKWGTISVPGNTSSATEPGVVAFGGTARTTLFIGTAAGDIYQVTVKVPGRVE